MILSTLEFDFSDLHDEIVTKIRFFQFFFVTLNLIKDFNFNLKTPETVANHKWWEELAPDHEKRWGVTLKKDRMKRPEEYKGKFSYFCIN